MKTVGTAQLNLGHFQKSKQSKISRARFERIKILNFKTPNSLTDFKWLSKSTISKENTRFQQPTIKTERYLRPIKTFINNLPRISYEQRVFNNQSGPIENNFANTDSYTYKQQFLIRNWICRKLQFKRRQFESEK